MPWVTKNMHNLAKDRLLIVTKSSATYEEAADAALKPVSDHLEKAWQSPTSNDLAVFTGMMWGYVSAVTSLCDLVKGAVGYMYDTEPSTVEVEVWQDQ